jgi:plastocyanin
MRKSPLLGPFVPTRLLFLAGLVLLPQLLLAQWTATIGAQSPDLGRQDLAFLPNEIWIHAGDSIMWTMAVDEIHTVSFLTAGQVRPPFAVGCPGFSTSPATFDGSTCVTTPPLANGQTFTVMFPTTGNFKLVCLVHPDMTGTVHVLDPSQSLPHGQSFYDQEARKERAALLLDRDGKKPKHQCVSNKVVTGGGEVSATAGGTQTLAIMRFDQDSVTIHVGHTVEWNNVASSTPHTITFGTEPTNLIPPSANVTTDADGALHGVVTSTSDSVHSGFIQAATQDRIGLAQAPPGVTRFRVTFTHPGTYTYICALHDGLGMTGKVIVIP